MKMMVMILLAPFFLLSCFFLLMEDNAVSKISDDEDDVHPNIDTPSLFRWRHQARVERMEEMQRERETHEQRIKDCERRRKEVEKNLEDAKKSGTDIDELTKSLAAIEKELNQLKIKNEEIIKKEKLAPWNVDTISKSGFSKTVVNTAPRQQQEELTDEEREKRMKEFTAKYEKEIEAYGMLRKYDDSKRYLQEHPHLVSEDTANYLVIWCINLEMRGKSSLMEHVSHQCICMQYMLELAKQLDVDPRACIGSFFSRIQMAEDEYKTSFDDELNAFKQRIRKRAAEKLEILVKEQEEEDRQKRLGPGGLDPVEVFETLPDILKNCFETKSIEALQEAVASLPKEEAEYHMKRCVDSGLWLPDANKAKDDAETGETSAESAKE